MNAELHVWPAKCAAVIAETCHRVNFVELINQKLEWDEDQTHVSPGELLLGLLINLLVDRKALYLLPQFFEKMELDVLFPRPTSVDKFNDDAIGRALDKLQQANGRMVLTTLAMAIIQQYQVPIRSMHVDTTSKSVHGVYHTEAEVNDAISVTFGYSKDQRPDLKQFLFGLGTTSDGVVTFGDVMSGNTSDKTWNGTAMEYVQKNWTTSLVNQIVWVADSAFATLANMAKAADKERPVRFISRLPHTMKLTDTLVERAWEGQRWSKIGALAQGKKRATYHLQSYEETIEGQRVRCVVVRSSSLDERKEKTITHQVEKEYQRLVQDAQAFGEHLFVCTADAHKAGEAFIQKAKNQFHSLSLTVEEVVTTATRTKRGRPGKAEPLPEKTVQYRAGLRVEKPDAALIREVVERAGTFVLVTNLLDSEAYTDENILGEYKGQFVVENSFRFLKDPAFVHALYLKNPARVEALGYVMLMAALIMSVLQWRVRQVLAAQGLTIKVPGNRLVSNPTARIMLEMLDDVSVIRLTLPDGQVQRMIPTNGIPKDVGKLLELLGYDASIYTISRWVS